MFSFRDQLLPATATNRQRAIRFVNAWQPDGFTNTQEAVLTALKMKDVDTIVLLSDGSPTETASGTIAKVHPILEKIRTENRFRNVVIHTLGFRGAKR